MRLDCAPLLLLAPGSLLQLSEAAWYAMYIGEPGVFPMLVGKITVQTDSNDMHTQGHATKTQTCIPQTKQTNPSDGLMYDRL